MRITKLGHCAMVVEVGGVKLLTDPGSYTVEQQRTITGLSAVLITHEHQDHLHIDSLKVLLANNPTAAVVSNGSVAKIIGEQIAGVTVAVVGSGESIDIDGIKIEGFGKDHEPIYGVLGLVENTSYFVAEKFYFPGDAFHNPGKKVDILALPVAGPWMKVSQAIDYAKEIRPRVAFGVHDGMIVPEGAFQKWPSMTLEGTGIEFVTLKAGETKEF